MDIEDRIALLRLKEEELTAAEKCKNAQELDKLVSEAYTGIHIQGKRLDKAEFISGCLAVPLEFTELRIENLLIKSIDSVGIVYGECVFEGSAGGQLIAGKTHYCDIWEFQDQCCRLISSTVVAQQ